MGLYRVDVGDERDTFSFWVEADSLESAAVAAKRKLVKDYGRRVFFRMVKATRPVSFKGGVGFERLVRADVV